MQYVLSYAINCAMLSPVNDDLIGSTEATRLLRVDKATISRWVASGTLTPAAKLPGRNGAFLFRRADIESLAAERASA